MIVKRIHCRCASLHTMDDIIYASALAFVSAAAVGQADSRCLITI